MSKQASQMQKKVMSLLYRGKKIFKPLNTGYSYPRLREKMGCSGMPNCISEKSRTAI